jgi:PAS domain S-box-containing protein
MGIIATLSIAVGLLYLALAVLALSRGLDSAINRAFFLLTLSLSVYSMCQAMTYEAPDPASAWRWFAVGTISWIGLFPGQVLLVIELTRRTTPRPRWLRPLVYAPVLVIIALALLHGTVGPEAMVATEYGWARSLTSIPEVAVLMAAVMSAYIFAALGLLIRWMLRLRSRREKRQADWLVGTGLVFMVALATFLALHPLAATPRMPRVIQIFSAIWAIGYAVAIFRHRLMAPTTSLAANAILDAVQDLVLLVDEQGTILTANARARGLLGYAPRNLQGRPLQSLGDPVALARCLAGPWQDSQPGRWNETVLRSNEGQEVPVLLSVTPILDLDGDRIGLAVVAQDQRPMREALKTERIESIGVLAGGIAHDFNNLLTAIGGYVSLAGLDVPEESETHRRLDEAGKACVRAQGLTRQLLTFSRGGAPIRKATSLEEVLRESASFVTAGSPVRVDIDVPSNLWLVDADEGQIAQVVHNLALNAVQAMPKGGVLHLGAQNLAAGSKGANGASTSSDRVRLTVRDEGQGIAVEHLDRIFEPFFTTKPAGTGLGLATVYSIVRRHEGEIGIDSPPGSGTTFRVDLPRARQPTGPIPLPGGSATGTTGRVLVMDDQPSVRRVAAEMLTSLGYQVVECRDGDEAILRHREALEQGRRFDAALLDLTVPGGLGGAEALAQMRAVDPDVRAIVSSGYAKDAEMANYRRSGFDRVLPKPYSLEALRDAVEGARAAPRARGGLANPSGEITP